jgi:hypothetical protein
MGRDDVPHRSLQLIKGVQFVIRIGVKQGSLLCSSMEVELNRGSSAIALFTGAMLISAGVLALTAAQIAQSRSPAVVEGRVAEIVTTPG